MYKRLMKIIVILVVGILLLTSCNSNEVNDGPELFTDIYYEIAKDDDFIREDQLEEHLKKYDKYNMEYNEKTHSYLITDPEESEENHVYISLMYESDLFNSITYFDANKNLQVTKEFRHALKEKPIYKTHVIGNDKEEVESIDEQIKFLKETKNEDYHIEEISENEDDDNIVEEIHNEDKNKLQFDLDYEITDGSMKPILKTNLPDGTTGYFTMEYKDAEYVNTVTFEVQDGVAKSEKFDNGGLGLVKGNYELEALAPLSYTQNKQVQSIIGDNYSNYEGEEIVEREGGVIVVAKVIDVVVE